jgi:hypothetical protein
VLATGIVAFLIWARIEREWPFGSKHIREDFIADRERAPRRALA